MANPEQPRRLPSPPEPRRLRIPVVVAVVVVVLALVIGGAGGYLIGHGTPGQVDSRAMGCELVKHLKSEGNIESWGGLDDARLWEAQAAGPLLHAASIRDSGDKELGEVGDGLTSAIMRLDTKKYAVQLDRAVQLCGRS
ncbi:hypothetical protein [Microlunatus soli]|uniref:Uncharacterized protein n=1 Tax=Microlunatus soli TaxID=630515 RepID=A0A1H1W541_9ACTN|nr:hypothetical protein [Microlunatus soli]SDS91329.1 hypothetical protein SAMN04489812_3466 [Microlunatus soli]